MNAEEKLYWFWLSGIEEIGIKGRRRLLNYFGSAGSLFGACKEQLSSCPVLKEKQIEILTDITRKKEAEKAFHNLGEKGIQFVTKYEKEFPGCLQSIPDSPDYIFYKGHLPEETKPAIAIVGARDCSLTGRTMAEQMAKELAAAGISVISGMARGIDGHAQKAAILAGKSFGVLGCGVDICYPKENYLLYEALCERGGVISEYPPGSAPLPYHFPMRNRLIAGFCDALVVVEARKKSGTSITVDCALEQGKDVFVMPGKRGEKMSEGCVNLAEDGANVVKDARELIERMLCRGYDVSLNNQTTPHNIILEDDEKIVYAIVRLEPIHLNELVKKTGLSPKQLVPVLVALQMKGVIYSPTGNYYMAK